MTRLSKQLHACTLLAALFSFLFATLPLSSQAPSPTSSSLQETSPPSSASSTILHTTVRRVVLDVVVTGPHGDPVPNLTQDDFTVTEDNAAQRILSFDWHGFEAAIDYTPPKLPKEPPNTFINLPSTPEKGPLYVLLYDLVNMDNLDQQNLTPNQHADQMRGRQELVTFIKNAPEGARIAIFVRSDGLHLLQGFTSDKSLLLAAIDPSHPGPHIPQVYLMGQFLGSGDTRSGIETLGQLASYLDGLPGRKNLIWFSGTFPLTVFAVPSVDDSPDYVARLKRMMDLLARNQIAIYPVDVRGVVVQNGKAQNGVLESGAIVSQRMTGSPTSAVNSSTQAGAAASASSPRGGAGASLLQSSYFTEDEIAHETGGRAFYNDNDVAGELKEAVEAGSNYYTLSYSPPNRDYNGKIRNIKVTLNRKGCDLSYRRFYYGDPNPYSAPSRKPVFGNASLDGETPTVRPRADILSANMQHGAPIVHQLLFGITVHAAGAPVLATAREMTELVTNADRFRTHKGRSAAPVPLQRYILKYGISAGQFKNIDKNFQIEIAAAAFDADGEMLNATVSLGSRTPTDAAAGSPPASFFRVVQQLDVPTSAAFLRFAVYDPSTDRLGATEINLPLAPEPQTAAEVH